jgi:CheY-like chemotaxis protein
MPEKEPTRSEKPIIWLVEDMPLHQELVSEFLDFKGFSVSETFSTKKSVLEKLDGLSESERDKRRIIILDGNLSRESENGDDAREIAEKIRKNSPNAQIIGHSTDELGEIVDIDLRKDNGNRLGETVQNLLEDSI